MPAGRKSCLDPERALFCLGPENPLRVKCLVLINSKPFFIGILIAIFLNCVTMAVNQPAFTNPPWLDTLLYITEIIFIVIFGLEMIVKILANGLALHPGAYVREAWNIFDATIVIVSVVATFTNLGNVTALRMFRLLRPLRTISRVKQLKTLIAALFLAVPAAMVNFVFLIFLIFWSAIFGLTLWSGNLNQRCYYDASRVHLTASDSLPMVWSPLLASSTNTTNSSSIQEPVWILDDSLQFRCGGVSDCPLSGPYKCMVDTKQFDATPLTFDTFGEAVLLVLKVTTIDAWNDEMTDTMNAVGGYTVAFYIFVTVFGGYFLINVFLAILMNEYSMAQQTIERKELIKRAMKEKKREEKNKEKTNINEFALDDGTGGGQGGLISMMDEGEALPPPGFRDAADEGQEMEAPAGFGGELETTEVQAFGASVSSGQSGRSGAFQNSNVDEKPTSFAPWGEQEAPSTGSAAKYRPTSFEDDSADTSWGSPSGSMAYSKRPTRRPSSTTGTNPYNERSQRSTLNQSGSLQRTETQQLVSDDSVVEEVDFDSDSDPHAPQSKLSPLAKKAMIKQQQQQNHTTIEDSIIVSPPTASTPAPGGTTGLTSTVLARRRSSAMLPTLLPVPPTNASFGSNSNSRRSSLNHQGPTGLSIFNPPPNGSFGRKASVSGSVSMDPLKQTMNTVNSRSFNKTGIQQGGKSFRKARAYDDSSSDDVSSTDSEEMHSVSSGSDSSSEDGNQQKTIARLMKGKSFAKAKSFVRIDGDGRIFQRTKSEAYMQARPMGAPILKGSTYAAADEEDAAEVHDSIAAARKAEDALSQQSQRSEGDGDAAAGEEEIDIDALDIPEEEKEQLKRVLAKRKAKKAKEDEVPVWRKKVKTFQEAFSIFMIFITVLNVAVVAYDYYGIAEETEEILDYISWGCTALFALEIVLKMIADGFFKTFKDGYNIFDLVLVLISVFEFLFSFSGTNAISALRALRLLRAFRAFRLAHRITGVYILIMAVLPTIQPALFVILLLCLHVFIYATLGMQLFGLASFGPYRISFGTIWDAALSCFIVVAGDDWSSFMVEGMKSTSAAVAVPYFLSLFGIGNFIILNLLAAVIIDNLDNVTNKEWERVRLQQIQDLRGKDHPPRLFLPAVPTDSASVELQLEEEDEVQPHFASGGGVGNTRRTLLRYAQEWKSMFATRFFILQSKAWFVFGPLNTVRYNVAKVLLSMPWSIFSVAVTCLNLGFIIYEVSGSNDVDTDLVRTMEILFVSFYCLEVLLYMLSQGTFVPRSYSSSLIDGSHIGGLIEREDSVVYSYFSSTANVVDFFVTITAILSIAVPQLYFLRSLRICKLIFRVESLKVTSIALFRAFPQMIQAFLLCLIFWFIFGILGVQLFKGRLYECTDSSINDEMNCTGTFESRERFITNLETNSSLPPHYYFGYSVLNRTRDWSRLLTNFDHVGYASLSLFAVAVGDGWYNVMFQGMDTTQPGQGLEEGANPAASLYFLVFFIVGNFFTLNLLMGVLINYFVRYKRAEDGSMMLTRGQRMYLLTHRIVEASLLSFDPEALNNSISRFAHRLLTIRPHDIFPKKGGGEGDHHGASSVTPASTPAPEELLNTVSEIHVVAAPGSPTGDAGPGFDEEKKQNQDLAGQLSKHIIKDEETIFEYVVAVINVFNVIVLALYTAVDEQRVMSKETELIIHYTMYGWYGVEILLHLVAFGPRGYLGQFWSRVDLLCSLAGFISLAVPEIERLGFIARLVRVIRIVKPISQSERAQKMIAMTIHGLPALLNLTLLFGIVFFIFGVVGVDLFKNVKFNGAIDEVNNFKTIQAAMLVLYQVMSTERWLEFAQACQIQEPDCSSEMGNCGTDLSMPFFIVFVFLSFFVLLQLCVALIVEHFEDLDVCAEREIVSSMGLVGKIWETKCGHRGHMATVDQVVEIIHELPLSVTKLTGKTSLEVFKYLVALHIPVNESSEVAYSDFSLALVRRAYHIFVQTMSNTGYIHLKHALPDRYCYTVAHVVASKMILTAYRRNKLLAEREGTAL